MNRTTRHLFPALLFVLAVSACTRRSRIVPVLQEVEFNDTPATANEVGVLRPGDRLLIEGVIGDPFVDIDGFSFRSGEPIHVDFQLFADRDLDVCLYDPEIDETVACFATAADPEQGGVDVFGSGLPFHLTVEACIEPGCFPAFGTPYTLELTVERLFLSSTSASTDLDAALLEGQEDGASRTKLRAIDAEQEADRSQEPKSLRRYRKEEAKDESGPELILEQHVELIVDEETGTSTLVHLLRASTPRGE